MRNAYSIDPSDPRMTLDSSDTDLLDGTEERTLLRGLAECKAKLAEALKRLPGNPEVDGAGEAEALAQYIARLREGGGVTEASLGAVARRYGELKSRLALANMRLVAHVAKRFRDRGISYSDLLQEGFCGLLEAIDRFDLGHETKLATYATWWIRQSMQQAVAAGAYPVRLTPRHLRQLAQSQDDGEGVLVPSAGGGSAEMIRRIHAATRPAVSLNATPDGETNYHLAQTMSDPETDTTDDVDLDETLTRLLGTLRPREQHVLELRFGLAGKPRLSLSQVGQVLGVSKERIRQIQDRALVKLRAAAAEANLREMAFDD
ncbi:MAG: polymerase, sigma 32 subunit, RpoH [Planctomycetota bacterium]|nr:polymerase, sigma 32 subunit, RpoH [Planctomycetota bacterium]